MHYPFALVELAYQFPIRLCAEEFSFLLSCDGKTPLEDSSLLTRYRDEGIVEPCEASSALLPEQEYRFFENWHFEYANWAITGRCNYNCRHCFAAVDTSPLLCEPTLAQCRSFIEQMRACGMRGVYINGGEPLLRDDFLDITRFIAQNDLRLVEISTNASLVTTELLDELSAQGHRPQFNVSFDGLGFHDWMRGVDGAEERTLEALRLLKGRDFPVKVQYCLMKDNLTSLNETTRLLSDIGIDTLRLIRVCESIRWMQNAPTKTLSVEDYHVALFEYTKWYMNEGFDMLLDIWGLLTWRPKTRLLIDRVSSPCSPQTDRQRALCGDARTSFFVASDGQLALCNQISGYMKSEGLDWGNVYKTPLQALLRESEFLNQLKTSVAHVREHNAECKTCEYSTLCNCGCRAVALATTGDMLGKDLTRCSFFKNGYYNKIKELKNELSS